MPCARRAGTLPAAACCGFHPAWGTCRARLPASPRSASPTGAKPWPARSPSSPGAPGRTHPGHHRCHRGLRKSPIVPLLAQRSQWRGPCRSRAALSPDPMLWARSGAVSVPRNCRLLWRPDPTPATNNVGRMGPEQAVDPEHRHRQAGSPAEWLIEIHGEPGASLLSPVPRAGGLEEWHRINSCTRQCRWQALRRRWCYCLRKLLRKRRSIPVCELRSGFDGAAVEPPSPISSNQCCASQ